jgi:hypothetical protein
MKGFTVVWHQEIEGNLLNLWMAAPDKNEVTQAADAIDAVLAKNPEFTGEMIVPGIRQIIMPPLAALFVVRPDDRIVEVVGIRRVD